MKLKQYILEGARRLAEGRVHCANTLQHMELIVQSVLKMDKAKQIALSEDEILPVQTAAVEEVLARRLQGEPLQYILGHAWFWNSEFSVGPGVLIPRKETEHTVEYLLSLEGKNLKVAELGPGSGNIGISVLRERPDWQWIAFEKNPDTVSYLKKNLETLLPKENAFHLQEGDFFEKVHAFAPYDIIVSNPPYISLAEYATLALELKAEPKMALVGGESGFEILEQLLKVSREMLTPQGLVVTEIASEQGGVAKELANRHGFLNVSVLRDYAGLNRVLVARKG